MADEASPPAVIVAKAKKELEELKKIYRTKAIDEDSYKVKKTVLLKAMEKARHKEKKAAMKKDKDEEIITQDNKAQPKSKKQKTPPSNSKASEGDKNRPPKEGGLKTPKASPPKDLKSAAKEPAAKRQPAKSPAASAAPATPKLEITSLSLHVSQLAFDVSVAKLKEYFEAHGCSIVESKGVRLCYQSNGNPTGVAFVDMVDMKSVKLGLKLHRSRFGGRLINVRPTRTEAELAEIVAKRNAALTEQGLGFKAQTGDGEKAASGAKRPRNESAAAANADSADDDGGEGDEGDNAEGGGSGGEKSKRQVKKEAAQAKRAKAKASGALDVARPNVEALAGREKWSESKKKRERANQKKRLAAEAAAAK